MANKVKKQGHGIKERIRKFFVSLKRSPHNIILVALFVSFVIYSLNLTSIANTTIKINKANMGQCEFAGMLMSILVFVCFLRSFPRRQKPKKVMIGLTFAMLIGIILVDFVYITRVTQALTATGDDAIVVKDDMMYIYTARNIMWVHIICTAICIALLALLPVYSKLLRKINTSIEVEGNQNMGTIDISGED